LFANVRPTFTFPSLIDNSPLKRERIEGTDLVFLRTYRRNLFWRKKEAMANGFDTCTYIDLKYNVWQKKGFELAMTRTKKCCVDKANVMETSDCGEKPYNPWKKTNNVM
jgi:3-isopropylmalate dehydrogenase